MKVLLDTHIFIWWADEPEKLSAAALSALEDEANELLLFKEMHLVCDLSPEYSQTSQCRSSNSRYFFHSIGNSFPAASGSRLRPASSAA
jgi:hypothetical protein